MRTEPPQPDVPTPDTGLRRMITWTLIALVASVIFSVLGVYLVTHWFGGP